MNKGEKAAFPQARSGGVGRVRHPRDLRRQIGRLPRSRRSSLPRTAGASDPGMLLLADRGFFSYALWRKASRLEPICCGEWHRRPAPRHRCSGRPARRFVAGRICARHEDRHGSRCWPGSSTTPSTTAATTPPLPAGDHPARPGRGPRPDLAAAYAQRWEIEGTFDELKTHQRGPRVVLRSKSPDLVLQEIWGHLCCHYAIRSLMAEAAEHPATTPTASASSPRSASRASPSPSRALFPPSTRTADPHWQAFLRRLLDRLNPARRRRSAPRVIKRKMPKWHVKRAHHTHWPQPNTHPTSQSIHPN